MKKALFVLSFVITFISQVCSMETDTSKAVVKKDFLWTCRSKIYQNLATLVKEKSNSSDEDQMKVLTKLSLPSLGIENLDDFTNFFIVTNNLEQKEEIRTEVLERIMLKELILYNNKIKEISHEQFSLLKNLKILNLCHNKLKVLSPSIALLKNLKELSINENKITELPKALTELKKLKIFRFDVRKINKLPYTLVEELPKLSNSSKEDLKNVIQRIEGEKV